MKKLFILCLLTVVPQVTLAHGAIENRTGLKSEAVIRNDLRQLGINPKTVTIKGQRALVRANVQGRRVILDLDRLTNDTRLISADAVSTRVLKHKLNRSLVKPAIQRPRIPGNPMSIKREKPILYKP